MSVLESLEVRSAIRSLRDVIPGEELNALEPTGPGEEWEERYARALEIASKDVLRVRKGRSSPRRAHPRRQKTTKWQKVQRKKQTQKTQTDNNK